MQLVTELLPRTRIVYIPICILFSDYCRVSRTFQRSGVDQQNVSVLLQLFDPMHAHVAYVLCYWHYDAIPMVTPKGLSVSNAAACACLESQRLRP